MGLHEPQNNFSPSDQPFLMDDGNLSNDEQTFNQQDNNPHSDALLITKESSPLSEKKRISISLKEVEDHFNQYPNHKEFPITLEVIQATSQITDIPELHDRLIAGTARLLGLSLITNDPIIQASSFVKTVW